MAAYCPKCNYKLKIRDWRPECPQCGVNILYYGIEDRLREEADAAEYHHALRQPKFDRLKFSLIGHPLSIARLAIGLLPILCLLLPMGKVEYALPFGTHTSTVNLVSIVKFFVDNGLDTGLVQKLIQSDLIGNAMIYWAVAIVALVLMALLTLVGFFLFTLSCSPRNFAFPIAGIVCACAAFTGYVLMVNTLNAALPGIFTGSVNPLAFIAVLLCFAAMITINAVYRSKKIEVRYTDVSELLLPYNERPSTIEKNKEKEAAAAAQTE